MKLIVTTCHPVVIILACMSIAYFVASIVYLVGVRIMKLGTPFKDSLSLEQRMIMEKSSRPRRHLFYISFMVALLVAVCLIFVSLDK
jgi:hypothetical protein